MKKDTFNDLNNKLCVITGGAGVICSAIAKGLGYAGVRTAIIDINKEMAEKVASGIQKDTGSKSKAFIADVLNVKSLEKVREVNAAGWDGLSSEGAPFLSDSLSPSKGPSCSSMTRSP